MTINIGRFTFSGPFTNTNQLSDISGVYAILDFDGFEHRVIDIGESAHVRTRVTFHDRAACWQRNTRGRLQVAVFYTYDRMVVEKELRAQFDPPCGER